MKKLIFVLLLPAAVYAEGPLFQHKDPAAQQEFQNVYKDLRSNKVTTSSNSVSCIDSPTFCVDAANDRVGIGTLSPSFAFESSTVAATTQVVLPIGSLATLGLTFNGDLDTGIWNAVANSMQFVSGGKTILTLDPINGAVLSSTSFSAGVQLWGNNGSVSKPFYSFGSDTGTGFYRSGTNAVSATSAGTSIITFDQNGTNSNAKVTPSADNAYTLGESGKRWTEVWAVNGTIQTSSSKYKREVRKIQYNKKEMTLTPLEDKDLEVPSYNGKNSPIVVPRGIVFKWKDKLGKANDQDIIGFVGDDLPEEAHAVLSDGTRDPENFYLSSVIGIFAAKIEDLEKRLEELEKQ